MPLMMPTTPPTAMDRLVADELTRKQEALYSRWCVLAGTDEHTEGERGTIVRQIVTLENSKHPRLRIGA